MEKSYRLNCILPNFTCNKQMYKKLYIKNIIKLKKHGLHPLKLII